MMTEKKFDKDVCGINFAVMFAYLDELGKDSSLICQRTGLTRNFLTSRREYVDLSVGTTIFNIVKEILDEKDPMVFFDIGKFSSRSRSLGVLPDIVQFLGNVEESVRYIPRFNRKFSELFDMSVYNVMSNSAVIVIHYKKRKYDGSWIFDQCAWNQGNIVGLPAFWDLPHMEIEEDLCRFSLQEIFRDYAFMKHDFRYENGSAVLNGKEFAVPVAIGVEDLKRSNDKLDKLNPFGKKEELHQVFSRKNYEILDYPLDDHSKDIPVGMLITRDTKISDMLILRKGQIFGAPYCRLNISWQGKKKISKTVMDFALERLSNLPKIIRALEEELDANINQKQDLINAQEKLRSAHHELQRYANNLEETVYQRTKELRDSQAKLIESEKRTLEHRITGGFAHEMRNALAGAQLEFKATLNYKDQGKSSAQILKDSVTGLLKNISLIHEKYQIPREEIATLVLPQLKIIAEIADHLSHVHTGVSSDLNRALSITTQIRNYARMSEFKPGDAEVDMVAMLKGYGDRYRQDFERIGIKYSVSGLEKAIVKADDIHMNSIFSNLILNAKDALEESEYDRQKEIGITVDKDMAQGGFVVNISDNGPGIIEENLNEIFEPFYSTKPTTGTGLGLGVVKRLIRLYDGQIDVKSKPGTGTKFSVMLPYRT